MPGAHNWGDRRCGEPHYKGAAQAESRQMLGHKNPADEYKAKLQFLQRNLDNAQAILRKASESYPVLQSPARAFEHVAWAVKRPMRLAILGETNSGKTSLANLIAGGVTLPAPPVANTRLPTLLQYAEAPFIRALYNNGSALALSPGDGVQLDHIIRLEVGLPNDALRWLEVLDFPGGENPLLPIVTPSMFRHGVDAAIWTTVASQAWRSSEQLAWLELPRRIRSRSLLAVTHCDFIACEEDLRRLQARLRTAAKPHFWGMCFVGASDGCLSGLPEATGTSDLISLISQLLRQFFAPRLEKAVSLTHRLAGRTLGRLNLATGCS
jgi:energy-coupling factor transporter ATP-binding protein EcfA2